MHAHPSGTSEIPLLHYPGDGLCSRNLGRRGAAACPEGHAMPDIRTHSPDNPEFARVLDVARLRGLTEFDFDLAPDRRRGGGARAADGARRRCASCASPGGCPRRRGGAWRLEARARRDGDADLRRLARPGDHPHRRSGASAVRSGRGAGRSRDRGHRRRRGRRRDRAAGRDASTSACVATEALALALPAYPRRADAPPRRSPPARRPAAAARPEAEVKPFAGARGAARQDGRRANERGARAVGIGLAQRRRIGYGPPLVFPLRSGAAGVTSRAASATPPRQAGMRMRRAAARTRSRSKDGCSQEQGHARQARHAPVA